MSWTFLLFSIAFEIGWASSLKFTEGYSRLGPSIVNALLAAGGVITLAQAAKTIPIALSYPIWTGVSLVGVVLLGVYAFGETIGMWHFVFIAFIAVGAVGLKLL
ncbi:MAG TPA: multidrug efflux SMR transporter [Acetobacteraceae bacterium]|jgi:quaternary ammonium compound-resistance protein SugE|nr:multidrug efflux SMR transporter [Acetobacteraceae bacterium]